MSRSNSNSKSPGTDFWSRRPFNKHGIHGTGSHTKKRTHKAERQAGRRRTPWAKESGSE